MYFDSLGLDCLEGETFDTSSYDNSSVSDYRSVDAPDANSDTLSENNAPILSEVKPTRTPRKLRVFAATVDFLHNWLSGKRLSVAEYPQDPFELQLLMTIARRKFGLKGESSTQNPTAEELSALLDGQVSKSKKRTEENNKLVFKYALKMLKARFKEERPELSVRDVDSAFLEHYFGDNEKSMGKEVPVLNPGQGGSKGSSFSQSNLRRLVQSAPFLAELKGLLCVPSIEECLLVKDYLSTIRKKLNKLFKRWEKRYL